MSEDYTTMLVEYMIPTTNSDASYVPDFFICTGDRTSASADARYRPDTNYIADGRYHTLVIPLSNLDFWSGKINAIRFDFFDRCSDGDEIYIRSIKLQ